MIEFKGFEKITRLNREVVVTEKIDGTNAQVYIRPADSEFEYGYDCQIEVEGQPHYVRAGSRNRWVLHVGSDDNHGFGRWVYRHARELAELGAGQHFGEWWGHGIQRGYGLTEKRFSLFNAARWVSRHPACIVDMAPHQRFAPMCCHVVPVLAVGVGLYNPVEIALNMLRERGSLASPGFLRPEGVAIYHTHSRSLFKVTLERDQEPKSMRVAAAL